MFYDSWYISRRINRLRLSVSARLQSRLKLMLLDNVTSP